MNLDRIRAVLSAALPLRPPRWPADQQPGARLKIAALEDYMLMLTYVHAELEEARHWLDHAEAELRAKVERITGYETLLPRKAQDRITQADINAAKAKVDPPTFQAGAEAKALRTSIERQLRRFEFERDAISRTYSMISGA